MQVPTEKLACIVGGNRVVLNRIQLQSGARVEINRFPIAGPSSKVHLNIFGGAKNISMAKRCVEHN